MKLRSDRHARLALGSVALLVGACSKPPVQNGTAVETATEPTEAAISTSATAATSTPSESATTSNSGEDEASSEAGRLNLTKGAQPLIAGRMLGSDEMQARFGDDWRDLSGRRFLIQAKKHDHHCDPRAQCMMGGVIPLWQDIRSIELCASCRKAPKGMSTVSCPIDDTQRAQCRHVCDTKLELCKTDAPSDGAQCTGTHEKCRQSCEQFADPECA